jgi:hypothetical protein
MKHVLLRSMLGAQATYRWQNEGLYATLWALGLQNCYVLQVLYYAVL